MNQVDSRPKIDPKKALLLNVAVFVVSSLILLWDLFLDTDEYIFIGEPLIVVGSLVTIIYYAVILIRKKKQTPLAWQIDLSAVGY